MAKLIEVWMRTYPTVAAVQQAHIDTIAAWLDHLPPPQTDVEKTVMRRIRRRVDDYIASTNPELSNSMDKVRELCSKLGIKMPNNIFTEGP